MSVCVANSITNEVSFDSHGIPPLMGSPNSNKPGLTIKNIYFPGPFPTHSPAPSSPTTVQGTSESLIFESSRSHSGLVNLSKGSADSLSLIPNWTVDNRKSIIRI